MKNNLSQPSRWKRGDKFSAGHLNETVDLVRAAMPITGGKGVTVVAGAKGTAVSLDNKKLSQLRVPIKIKSTRTGDAVYEALYGTAQPEYNPKVPFSFDAAYLFLDTSLCIVVDTEQQATGHRLDVNYIDWALLTGLVDKDTGLSVYAYDFILGNPQYKGRVLKGVSQNQRGWGLTELVGMDPED